MEPAWRKYYPFASRWHPLTGGARMHYIDEGSGSPLLMIHGNPSWSFLYRGLIANVRNENRCIAPDHIGCGLSDKPSDAEYDYTLDRRVADLESLILALDLHDITLIVHDWGGMIGFAAALRHPQRFRRFIVLNTSAFLKPPGVRLHWTLWFIRNLPLIPSWLIMRMNMFAEVTALTGVVNRMPPEIKSGFVSPYEGRNGPLATLRFVQDIPLGPSDRSYPLARWVDDNLHLFADRPMLLAWGLEDYIFHAGFLDEWQRRFPRAECSAYESAGHYVLEDQLSDVTEKMRSFFARNPLSVPSETCA